MADRILAVAKASYLLRDNDKRVLKIPMTPEARSLNLATSVGIALYEGLRQVRT